MARHQRGGAPPARAAGVVGLGAMGAAVAGRLLDAGFEVTVTNRSPARGRDLVEAGARWAASPRALARQVPVALTLVSDDTALEQVVAGPEGLLAAGSCLLVVDLSTVSPEASARVAASCAAAGAGFVRAPVSGGPPLARTGKLGVLLSGPEAAREAARPVLDALAASVFLLGDTEEARVMKLALNMLIGTTVVGLGEALVLGERWGLDWVRMLDVFTASAIASPFVTYKAPLLARRDFPPAFSSELLAKDLGLAAAVARDNGAPIAVTERAREVVEQAIEAGLGGADATSVVLLLEQVAGAPEAPGHEDPLKERER